MPLANDPKIHCIYSDMQCRVRML